jgi:hypothetical protein
MVARSHEGFLACASRERWVEREMLNHVSQAVMRSTEEFASAILKADRGIEPLQDFTYTQVHWLA